MRKLLCKNCGNAEFYVLDVSVTLCKCGARLTKLRDYRLEESTQWKEHYYREQKRQAEVISRISLLKREIDKCLDEHNQERFHKLAAELKICQSLVTLGEAPPNGHLLEKLKRNKDKV